MDFAVAYLNSFGLAALISIAFGVSLRTIKNPFFARMSVGLLFGVAAALAMQNPIPIASGVFVDPRNLFVGLSAAFLGPLGALASLAVAATTRLVMGGVGVGAGLLSMFVAASAGLVWAHLTRNRDCTRPHCLLMLGAMISLALVGTTLLPHEAMIALLVNAGPYIICFNLVGAVLFGSLMVREQANNRHLGQLNVQATTDPLTGLLNRRGFEKAVEILARPIHEGGSFSGC